MKRELKFTAWDGQKMLDWSELQGYFVSTLVNVAKNNDWKFLQFTGLKDRNGVEIYEGDVLRESWIECSMQSTGVPEWPQDFCSGHYIGHRQLTVSMEFDIDNPLFLLGLRQQECWDGEELFGFESAEQVLAAMGSEVIGNIYENPELLEKEKVDFQTSAVDG